MSFASKYQEFLASPNSSLLAANATLHYITTTTNYNGPTDVIKHFGTLRNQVKKKKEELLDLIEGQKAIAIEIDTTLEFLTSGGPYLPGLDDNFLSDRTVHLPIMHVVAFDNDGKITQIRQSWDQGSLLKQLEVIGRTGRNWPVRDSRDQLKLILTCLKTAGKISAPADTNETIGRSRGNSNNALRDPHASLSLFGPREEVEEAPAASLVSPYAGTRPRQRSFTEILGDEPEEVASPSSGRERPESPSKAMPPKIGSSKNYQPIRIFEAEELAQESAESPEKFASPKVGSSKNYQPIRLFEGPEYTGGDTPEETPDRAYRPNPKKYNHFDFADGSDPQDAPKAGVKYEDRQRGKHDSTWDFEDFVTPQKFAPAKMLRHQDRHWDPEDVQEAPKQPAKVRRDAETHFEFQDDGIPVGERRPPGRPKGAMHNTGLGLYQNNLYNEDGTVTPGGPDPRALGTITNLKDRQKTFDSHWDMTDNPPPAPETKAQVSEDRMKAVKMMDSNWAAYDESPAAQKENNPANGKDAANQGIHIAGDGMGGKKGTNREWIFGDDSQDQTPRAVPGKKPAAPAQNKGFWDF